MYEKVGEISEAARQALLAALPRLRPIGGGSEQEADYSTTPKMDAGLFQHAELAPIPESRERAIAVKLAPGGKLHKHTHDLERDQNKTRYQVVLATNDGCTSRNGEMTTHLDDRGIYRMTSYLEHEAWNEGATDRIHLVFVTLDGV